MNNSENTENFLMRSENAVRALLHQNATYAAKIKKIQKRIPLDYTEHGRRTSELTFGNWWMTNKTNENVIFDASQKYSVEAYTSSLLSGSILKIAAKAIDSHSKNTYIPDEWPKIFKKRFLPARFFVGRSVYTIPIGLVIFCGLNQFINTTDREIEALNREVFTRLATYSGRFEFQAFVGLETSYRNLHSQYLATSVLEILGWTDYDNYFEDMRHIASH